MKLLFVLMLGCVLLNGCGSDPPKEEQETIDLGHPNDPTAIRAYKGAKDAQKQIQEQQQEDQSLLNQADQQPIATHQPDGGFGTLDDARDIRQQVEQQQQESEQALEDTNQ